MRGLFAYLAAAFTGLRGGELLALRRRDVDFATSTLRVSASFAAGAVTSPKSGKPRAVPLVFGTRMIARPTSCA